MIDMVDIKLNQNLDLMALCVSTHIYGNKRSLGVAPSGTTLIFILFYRAADDMSGVV